ncbi:uncharacterized protein LOC135686680 isoform X2 [Rhopilema esculentum]|uniref:uncharacterized protein LOC135686680 isoform X2 n=1 Tax=Rhopilema esculentum TaxID=499914 RepID=UPI0031DDB044
MTSTRSKSRKSQKSSEKENSAFSNSSQSTKFPRESLFDFNDSDEEQFDVKSSKRSFRVKKGSNSDTGIKSKKDLKGSKKRAPKSVAGGSKAKENTHQKQEKKISSVHKDDLAVSSSIYQTKTSDLPEKKYNRHIDISIVSNEDFLCDKEIQHNKDGEKKKLDGPIATKEEVLRMATSTDNLEREPKTIVFKGSSENTEDAIESHVNDKIDIEKNASDKCPLCLKNFPASSTDYDMNMHVNACLDGENGNDNARSIANTPKITNTENNKVSIAKMDDKEISDEKMAKILQEREDEKAVEENLTCNLHFCAICQKDLNHLSTDSRQIHLNKCADISEKETASIRKAEIKSAKENSKQFECIICGLLFSTMQQKISHMKQCSRENKVDQRELLKLVKETNEKSLNAVLMSSQKESGSALVDGSNSKKQKFHKRKGKSRRKIRNEEIPVLLTRSEADAKKIAASIANKIVMEQMHVPACLDKENKTSFPQSSLERKYCKNAKDAEIISSAFTVETEGGTEETKSEHPIELKPKKRLWDLADNSKSLGETACFYVVEIFGDDYIRTKKRLTMKANTHGAELQKHHAFDDVDREILCDSDKDEETVSKKQFIDIPSREEALNQSLALTQSEKTAIIENLGKTFADVCDNDDDTPIDKSRESKDMDIEEHDNDLGSGFVRNEISDYKDHKQDEVRLSKFRNLKENVQLTLISNMKSLLQDVISSDMKIKCANGKETHAHKCILFARCPQMRTEQSQMDLTDFSVEAVKFFLAFIYYGEIDVRPEVAVEVFKLASRYSMDPLAEACLMIGNEAELKDVDFCEESYSKNTNVDEVMKNLLADDDYDGEEEGGDEYARTNSETKVDENILGIGDSPFNESDEEDLREFFVTQRVRRNSLEDDVDSEKSDLNELAQLAPDDTLDNQNLIRGDNDNDCNDFDSNDCEGCDRSDDNDCCVDGNDTAPGRDVDDRDDDGVVYDCDDCDVDNERDGNEEDLEIKRKSCDNKERIFVSVDDSSADSKYSQRDGTSPKQSLSQNRMLPSDAVTSVRSLRSLNVTSNGDESISCNKEEDTEMQEWEKRIEAEKCSTSLAKSRINEDSITSIKDDNDEMEIIGDDDDQNKGLINESLSSNCCDLTDDQTPNQFQNKSVEGKQNNSDEEEDYFGTSSEGLNFTLHLEEDDNKKEAPEMGNRESGDNKSDIFLVTPARQTPQLLENTFATPALYSAGTFSNPGDQWNTGEGGVLPFSKRGSSSRRSDCMSNASDQKEAEESPYARRPIKGKGSRLGDRNQKETMKIQSSGSEEGEKRIPVGRGYTAKKQLLVDLSRDIDVELYEPEESIEGESPVKCLSGSELQNKSVLLEPLSPCVTTSQFERKGKGNDKEEQDDHLKSVSTNLPLLSQRNVIDVDADDQDDIDEISISRSSNITGNNQASPRRSDSFFDDAMSDTFDVMELNPHALDTSGECVARADSSHSDVIDVTDSAKQARCARNRLDFEMSEGSSDEVIDTTPKKKNDTSQYTTSFNNRNISSSQGEKSEGKNLDGEGQAHKQTNGSRRRKREDRSDDFSDSEENYPSRKMGMTPRKSFSKRGRREGSPQSITLQKSNIQSAKDASNMQRVECMLNESSSSLKSDIDIPNENNHSEHLEELSPLCLDMSKGPQRYAENSPMDKSELNAVHLKAEPENDNITGSLPSSMHSFNDDGGFNPDLDFGVQTQTDNKAHVETRLSDAHFQIRSSPHSLLTGEPKAHSATFEEIAEVRDAPYEMEDEENNDFSDCYIDDGGFNCDVPQDLNQISNISNTVLHDIDVSSDESLTFPIVATNKGSKMSKKTLSDNIGSIREYQGEQHVSREAVNLKEQDVGRKEDANNSLDRELSNSQNSKHTASSVTPVRSSMQTMKTPNTALRNFGPGCKFHPETGASITPMSDYDTLHTPDLTKRVKNFGMRKLPKHQMAGKLREIYKVNHGFAHWEEPPTKAHRKRKANVKTKKKVTNEPNEKASSTNKQQGNESEENSHSVERNDQSDTEHSSSSADERQKTFEGIDCSDDEKSSQTSQNEETQSDESISEKLSRFMKSNKDFYHKILTYQKLSFEDIYKAVKEAKLKCTKARLMDFLDDQCICVVFPKADDQARPQRKRWKKR